MNDDHYVLETARTFIQRYGAEASVEADLRATELLEHNKMETHAFWVKVKEVISDLQQKEQS